MYRLLSFTILVVLLALTAAAQESKHARGHELLQPFKEDLQRALKNGLAQGPVAAIDACQLQAPELARALAKDGVRVGRASDRLRNPANVAPAWVAPILADYVKNPSSRWPAAVYLHKDRAGYVEPIIVQALCLTCHGSDIAPALAARINERYPADRAIDYEVGDLRGVFWVEYPRLKKPKGDTMIVVTGTIRLASRAELSGVLDALAKRAKKSRNDEGNIDYVFAQNVGDPTEIRLIEKWVDEAALHAHLAIPDAEFNAVLATVKISSAIVVAQEASAEQELMRR